MSEHGKLQMAGARRPLRFTLEDARRASDEWGFNCGPGALCAVLNLTPDEIRPKLGEFESKGYTNPTLMLAVLDRVGAKYQQTYRADIPKGWPQVKYGLMRIQWGGPWTKPGVPMRARYRQTHWIGVRGGLLLSESEVFDINAVNVGGWIPFANWADKLVPWLCAECVPKWDGTWWPTHAIEVEVAA